MTGHDIFPSYKTKWILYTIVTDSDLGNVPAKISLFLNQFFNSVFEDVITK